MNNYYNTKRRRLLTEIAAVTMCMALVVTSTSVLETSFKAILPSVAAYAKENSNKYESNQVTNKANECGDGALPLDIFCDNLGTEIYGNENVAAATSTQTSGSGIGTGNDDNGNGNGPHSMNKDIGVLVYTHGYPDNPLTFKPDMHKLAAIEYDTENQKKLFGEKIIHMPYIWDYGLMGLDKTLDLVSSTSPPHSTSTLSNSETIGSSSTGKYAIFLYTDLFGPNSTVIHNVTRGVFGGIEEYNHCPGVVVDESNSRLFDSEHQSFTAVVQKYGPICFYMGHIHIPAEKFSDTKFVFAEPARPDHPILREIFVKQVAQVSTTPEDEIIVLVGHGARSDTNDNAQKLELSCAADYAATKSNFAGSLAVTAREDWHDLAPIAVQNAVTQIQTLLQATGAERVVLVPATGSGSGFKMVTDALTASNIPFVTTPETLPIGEQELRQWAQQTLTETMNFIRSEKPTQSTITPQWDRTYGDCNTGGNNGGGTNPPPGNEGHGNGENGEGGHANVVRDSQTILLEGMTIPAQGFIHLYDSTQYLIANGHVAINVPCSEDSVSSTNVLLGQAPNLVNAELENLPELSSPGSMCLYHADIPPDDVPVTDVAVQNPMNSDLVLPAGSSVVIGVNEIVPGTNHHDDDENGHSHDDDEVNDDNGATHGNVDSHSGSDQGHTI
jgi:hypothetical protein